MARSGGATRRGVANLEDISLSGACLQVIGLCRWDSVPHQLPEWRMMGKVKYCVFREIGYFLGIEFEPGTRWSQRHFRPQHLLDPRRLVTRATDRLKTDLPPAAASNPPAV